MANMLKQSLDDYMIINEEYFDACPSKDIKDLIMGIKTLRAIDRNTIMRLVKDTCSVRAIKPFKVLPSSIDELNAFIDEVIYYGEQRALKVK